MQGTVLKGVLAKPGTDKYILIPARPCKSFNVTLTHGVPWYMGIDQSTSCTGIALMDGHSEFVMLLDVIRDKNAPIDEYYRDLRRLLGRLAKGQRFDLIANERPVPTDKKKYTRDVLTEFLGRLNSWLDDIEEFDGAQREQLFPQVWKSLVVDKSKGPHRSNVKEEIARDLVDKYPELYYYFHFEHTKDYDSFDALGILTGAIQYAFTADGYPKIHGSKEKRHVSLVLYDWIDWDPELSFDDNVRNAIIDNIDVFSPYILHYNDRYSLHDNIRMASSNYNCTATVLPKSELMPFKWKYGIDPEDDSKRLLALILKRGEFTSGIINSAKRVYPWHEEVYDE